MQKLRAVDKIEVIALMDNLSDPFTEMRPGMRFNEFQYQFGVNKHRHYNGSQMCLACTGLSLLIKLTMDDQERVLLFDAGPDDGLVVENAKRLGVDLSRVEALVISHGHFDHYGGTLSVLDAIGKKQLPVHIHPELFAPRAFDLGNNELLEIDYVLTEADITAHHGAVVKNSEAKLILDDMVLISGEVPRKTSYETGLADEMRKTVSGEWEFAPDVIDERFLVVNLKDQGLCVFAGCSHMGVVNATRYAQQLCDESKVHLLMGGFHLAGPDVEERIPETMQDLSSIDPQFIITGHCTGALAQQALTAQFGDRHMPYGVATVFRFSHEF